LHLPPVDFIKFNGLLSISVRSFAAASSTRSIAYRAKTIRNIAIRKHGCGNKGAVADFYAVMHLIAFA